MADEKAKAAKPAKGQPQGGQGKGGGKKDKAAAGNLDHTPRSCSTSAWATRARTRNSSRRPSRS